MPDVTRDADDADDTGAATLAELAELRALARSVAPGDVAWETPPADLWARIEAGVAAADEPAADRAARSDNVRRLDSSQAASRRAAASRRPDWAPDWPPNWPSNWRVWTAAAAAALVIVVAVGVLWPSGSSDDSTVVAAVALAPLGESGAGRAELVEHDGSLQLRLSTSGIDADVGFFEVWVINPDVTQLISLGPLRDDGVYDLPPGLDPATFPIVDVSVEPIDGDPTHSGDSVLRGQLPF